MANSLITIKLKMDALKVEIDSSSLKSLTNLSSNSTPNVSTDGGAGKNPASPSSSSSDVDELRKQFIELTSELKAVALSMKGVNEVSTNLKELSSAIKQNISNNGASAEVAPSSTSSNKQSSDRVISSTDNNEDSRNESFSSRSVNQESNGVSKKSEGQATDSSDKHVRVLKEESAASNKAADSAGSMINALGSLQGKWINSVGIHKDSEAALQSLNRVSQAKTIQDLELASSLHGKKSPIAVFLESLLPAGTDSDLKATAESLNKDVSSFLKIGPEVNKTSSAFVKLQKELSDIQKVAYAQISNNPAGVDINKVARTVNVKQTEALDRFKSKPGSSDKIEIKKEEQGRAINALGFVKKVEEAASNLQVLSRKIKDSASTSEKAPIEAAINQSIEGLIGFTSKVVGSKSSPFEQIKRVGASSESLGDKNLSPDILKNIAPTSLDKKLSLFQKELISFTNSLIKTNEVSKVLPAVFRKLSEDVGNFEENQRVLKDSLTTGGTAAFGGPDRFSVAGDVSNSLKTKLDSGGRFVTPSVTDTNTSFELLRLNIKKLKADAQSLQKGTSLSKVFNFTDAAGTIKKVQITTKQLGSTLDSVKVKAIQVNDSLFSKTSIKSALSRIATWGAAAGLVFGAITAFRKSITVITETESSLVKLAKVMDESKINFDGFINSASKAAIEISQKFGQPLNDVLETMITFGQQGLTFPEVKAGTEASALASVVTTLNQPQAAEALTAATEQFGIGITDATSIVDKFNNVANNAAVTETILAEALKKSGIAATNAGVDLDQFNGIVAAISEQTRQSGQEVGTALRFIFSRINTEKAETGLAKIGIAVKDASGNLRPFVSIISDLKSRFGGLTKAQQTQAAISIAGTRRFNTLLALLKNYDTFQKSVINSTNSAGSSIEQQGIVAETSAFKITQLKNAAAGVAVSFGSVLSPAIKTSTDIAKGFLDLISNLPSAVQGIGVAAAASGIAIAKFGETFSSLGDAALPGTGLFSSLSSALTKGESEGNLRQRDIGLATSISQKGSDGGAGIFAARAVGDFAPATGFFSGASKSVTSFSASLKEAGSVLVDSKGKVIENSAQITKFTAVTNGYKTAAKEALNATGTKATQASNLGLLTMNTTIGKLASSIVGLSGKFVAMVPLIGTPLDSLTTKLQQSSKGSLRLAGSILKVGLASAGIYAAFKGFELLKDIATSSGDSVAKGLSEEISTRQKVVRELSKQKASVEGLAQAQNSLFNIRNKNKNTPETLKKESIRRGSFKSSSLEEQRFNAKNQKAINLVGFENPELISSIDEFGNVALTAAASFDVLSESTVSANEKMIALSQVKIAKAFAEDIEGADGLIKSFVHAGASALDFIPGLDSVAAASVSTGKAFREASEEFDSFRNSTKVKTDIGRSNKLGVSLGSINKDASQGLASRAANVQKAALGVTDSYAKVIKAIEAAPKGTGETLVESFSGILDDVAKLETKLNGVRVTTGDVAGKLLLITSKGISSIKSSIKFSAQDTKEALNENGFLNTSIKIGDNVAKTLQDRISKGDLVIVGSSAVKAEVDAFGDLIVKKFNEATGRVEIIKLADLIDSEGVEKIDVFSTKGIKEQIAESVAEIQRTVTGAGRGILLPKEFDLGAASTSDLSSQQRAAKTDEGLFSKLGSATRDLDTLRDAFKAKVKSGGAGPITAANKSEIDAASSVVDNLSSIIRFRVALEDVGKSFEKAANSLEDSRITSKFTNLFSGKLGAESGITSRQFNKPLLKSQLSVEQRTNSGNPKLIARLNQLTEAEKSIGKEIASAALSSNKIDKILSEIKATKSSNGILDNDLLSQLRDATTPGDVDKSEAQKLQEATNNQLLESKTHGVTLNNILSTLLDQPANLASTISSALISGDISEEKASNIVKGISKDDIKSIPTKTLTDLISAQGGTSSSNVLEEVANRKSSLQSSKLITSFTSSSTSDSPPDSKQQAAKNVQSLNLTSSTSSTEQSSYLAEIALSLKEGQNVDYISIAKEFANRTNDSKVISKVNDKIKNNPEDVVNLIKNSLNRISEKPVASKKVNKKEETLSLIQEANKVKNSINRLKTGAENTLNSNLVKQSKDLAEAFLRLSDSASSVGKSIEDNLNSAIEDIRISDSLSNLGVSGDASGILAGVEKFTTDFGVKDKSELSGKNITEKESTSLVKASNSQKVLLDSLLKILSTVEQQIGLQKQAQSEALKSGDTKKAAVIGGGIDQLSLEAKSLAPKIQETASSLRNLSEVASNTSTINQFTQDINGLVSSLDKEIKLNFDKTSIDSALGNTVFSLLRPTFEQFEQGQSGFATKFDRDIADAKFQRSSGSITSGEESRLKRKATFSRDEGVIQIAQSKENKSLQVEVQAAEQIRQRLLEFSTSGTSGSGEAKALFNSLTQELESAGDIQSSGFGSKSIRNPLTGSSEVVPASKILEFKGISSLGSLQSKVGELARAAKQEESQKQATLINTPIVDAIDRMSADLLSGITDIGTGPESEGVDNNLKATEALIKLLPAIEKLSGSEGVSARQQEAELSSKVQDLNTQVGPESLSSASKATFLGDSNIESIITKLLESGSGAEGRTSSDPFLDLLNTDDFSNSMTEAASTVNQLKESMGILINQMASFYGIPGGVQTRAGGGVIYGPGGPTEDKVPLLASPGEYVIKAQSAARIGIPNLNRINSTGSIQQPNVQKFKDGGLVEEQDYVTTGLHRVAASKPEVRGKGRVLYTNFASGQDVYESDEAILNINHLKKKFNESPNIEQIRANTKNLREEERRRVLDLEQDNKRRLRIFGGELTKPTYFTVLEDGTPSFRDTPTKGYTRIGRDTLNVDISSYEGYKADIKQRKDTEERIAKGRKEQLSNRQNLASKLTRAEVVESDRLGSYDYLNIEDDVRGRLSENKKSYSSLGPSVRSLLNIAEKTNSASGRQFLANESSTVKEEINKHLPIVKRWNSKFLGLRETDLQIRDPHTGDVRGEPIRILTGGETLVSPTKGIVGGNEAYSHGPTIDYVKGGGASELIRVVEELLKGNVLSEGFTSNIGNFDFAKDALSTSNAPTAIKIAGGLGLGVASSGFEGVKGLHSLAVNAAYSPLGLATGQIDIKDAPKGLKGVLGGIVKAPFEALGKTGNSLGNLAGGIYTGASDEELVNNSFDTGSSAVELINAVGGLKGGIAGAGKLSGLAGKKLAALSKVRNASRNISGAARSSFTDRVLGGLNKAKKGITDKASSAIDNRVRKLVEKELSKVDASKISSKNSPKAIKDSIPELKNKVPSTNNILEASKLAEEVSKGGLISRGVKSVGNAAKNTGKSLVNKGNKVLSTAAAGVGGVGSAILLEKLGINSDILKGAATVVGGTGSFLGARSLLNFAGKSASSGAKFIGSKVKSAGVSALSNASKISIPKNIKSISASAKKAGTAIQSKLKITKSNLYQSAKREALDSVLKKMSEKELVDFTLKEQGAFNKLNTKSPFKLRNDSLIELRTGRVSKDLLNDLQDELFKAKHGEHKFVVKRTNEYKKASFERLGKTQVGKGPNIKKPISKLKDKKTKRYGIVKPESPPSVIKRLIDKTKIISKIKGIKKSFKDSIPLSKKAFEFNAKKEALNKVLNNMSQKQLVDFTLNEQGAFDRIIKYQGQHKMNLPESSLKQLRNRTPSKPLLGSLEDELLKAKHGSKPIIQRRLKEFPGPTLEQIRAQRAKIKADFIAADLQKAKILEDRLRLIRGEKEFDVSSSKNSNFDPTKTAAGKKVKLNKLDIRNSIDPSKTAVGKKVLKKSNPLKEDLSVTGRGFKNHNFKKAQSRDFDPSKTVAGGRKKSKISDVPDVKVEGDVIKDKLSRAISEFVKNKKNNTAKGRFSTSTSKANKLEKVKDALLNKTVTGRTEFATGGFIKGPGGPKQDSIPIMASNGEFVINAATVSKLGVPFFDRLNKGNIEPQKFATGGLIGGRTNSSSKQSKVNVQVNTSEIKKAIYESIQDAFDGVDMPKLEVNLDGVSVPLDIPVSGIPLDSSSISIDNNLGSGIRDRIEQVEGSLEGLREDSNKMLDFLENIDMSEITTIVSKLENIDVTVTNNKNEINNINTRESDVKTGIMNEVFTLVNQQIDNITIGTEINNRMDVKDAKDNSRFNELTNSVLQVMDTANKAMTQALSRN